MSNTPSKAVAEVKSMSLVPAEFAEIGLGKDDFVSIVANEYEEKYLAEDARLEQEGKRVGAELKPLQEAADKQIEADAKDLLTSRAEDFQTALKLMPGWGKAVFTIDGAMSSKSSGNNIVTATVHFYQSTTAREQARTYCRDSITFSDTAPPSSALRAAIKAVSDKQREIEQVAARRVEVRKALSQVTRVERKARAAIARQAMERTEQGRKLLGNLRAIKSLPGLLEV